jgi:collagenase-like PrtC family protease
MSSRLILPTNWDPALLTVFAELEPAYVYGSLASEATLRSPLELPEVTEAAVAEHVRALAARRIPFVYVMNGSCLGNREYSEEGRADLLQKLEWLREVGAAAVVTANPFVMELVRQNFADLELHVSVLAEVNDPRKARFFESLGASVIHVDPQANRDFPRLRAIRRAVRCRLSVVVNEGCLLSCPIRGYHANLLSHAGESIAGRFHVDYCYYRCSLARDADPVEYVRMPWIRPQDLGRYEEIGFDYFKLAGREKMGAGPSSHTGWIERAARAYHTRHCADVAELLVGIQDVESPFGDSPPGPRVRIDSGCLEGFLRYFAEGWCDLDCERCGYCAEWARRAVRIEGDGASYRRQLEADLERIRLGSYWTGTH